jgi:hypothetical protein
LYDGEGCGERFAAVVGKHEKLALRGRKEEHEMRGGDERSVSCELSYLDGRTPNSLLAMLVRKPWRLFETLWRRWRMPSRVWRSSGVRLREAIAASLALSSNDAIVTTQKVNSVG